MHKANCDRLMFYKIENRKMFIKLSKDPGFKKKFYLCFLEKREEKLIFGLPTVAISFAQPLTE